MNSEILLKTFFIRNLRKSSALCNKCVRSFSTTNVNAVATRTPKWRTVKLREILQQMVQMQLMKLRLFDEKRFLLLIGDRLKMPVYRALVSQQCVNLEKHMNLTLNMVGKKYSLYTTELTKFDQGNVKKLIRGNVDKIRKTGLDSIKRNITEVRESNEYFLAKKYAKIAFQQGVKAAGKLYQIVQNEMKKQKGSNAGGKKI